MQKPRLRKQDCCRGVLELGKGWRSGRAGACPAGFLAHEGQLCFSRRSAVVPRWQLHREQDYGSCIFLAYYISWLWSSAAKWQKQNRISVHGAECQAPKCHLALWFLSLPRTLQYLTFHRMYWSKLSPNCSNDLLVKSKLLAKLQALIISTESNCKKTTTFKAVISYSMTVTATPWSIHATSSKSILQLTHISPWNSSGFVIPIKKTKLWTVLCIRQAFTWQ